MGTVWDMGNKVLKGISHTGFRLPSERRVLLQCTPSGSWRLAQKRAGTEHASTPPAAMPGEQREDSHKKVEATYVQMAMARVLVSKQSLKVAAAYCALSTCWLLPILRCPAPL